MITYLAPLPVGNAVRCMLSAPDGAQACQVLRRANNAFVGVNDASAIVVYSGDERGFIDSNALLNSVPYWYLDYWLVDAAWVAGGAPQSATPAAINVSEGPDPQEFLRDRLEYGLKAEVDAGRLKHVDGAIPTLSAPPIYDDTQFPVVTVHLGGQSMFARGLGEMVAPDAFDVVGGLWEEDEGSLDQFRLTIVGWVVGNPDTRISLRKAINRILRGNMGVMADKGIILPEWSAADSEDFESYGSPMYMSVFTFTCVAPVVVEDTVDPITDVTVDAEAEALGDFVRVDIAA